MIGLLLRLYPRAWRERYGNELSSLVDDTGLTPAAAVDMTRGAINEWTVVARDALNGGTTMVIGPAYRHPRPWAIIALVLLAPTLLFTLFSMLTYQFGLTGLARVMDPVNTWLNGQRNIEVVYSYGYKDLASLPYELRKASAKLVAAKVLQVKGMWVSAGTKSISEDGVSKSFGDGAYSTEIKALKEEAYAVLKRYKRITV